MKPLTNDEFYDYHAKKIIKSVCENMDPANFENGDELENFLAAHRRDLADEFMTDIAEYFGFDEMLRMIQESS